MRLDIGNSESIPTTLEEIQAGDYISSRSVGWPIMGKVVATGHVLSGRHSIREGFLIQTAQGKQEFVAKEDTRILGLD